MADDPDQNHAPDAHPQPNRLAGQASPYLLQHAFNPVAWWPWGPAAFAEARRRDVPIFLSIGYSTCYWCHVMERESFESVEIAQQLNAAFVCIKVDREERPDVDDIYMAALQAFSGRGGWPLTAVLEPQNLRPFWAGTYLPPDDRMAGGGGGMPGLPRVIEGLSGVWRDRRDEVIEQAEQLAEAARERVVERFEAVRPTVDQVGQAVQQLLRLHDRRFGGFGPAPKFPQPAFLELLLDVREAADESTRLAIDAACKRTLDEMALGGVYDQVGGGFHRYSVDERWTVPHFEKMLYDNAQLALVYARAWSVWADPLYRRTAVRTLDYVLREMTDPSGAFWAAQDAEVHAREGLSYLWTAQQIRDVLPKADAEVTLRVYGVDAGPNFRDPHHPAETASNVLRWSEPPGVMAERLGMSEAELVERMSRISDVLLRVRDKRDQPSTDDKVICAWNGMMVHAMANCAMLLGEPRYFEAAKRAFAALVERVRQPDGTLLRTWRRVGDGEGGARVAGAMAPVDVKGNDAGTGERAQGTLEDYGWFSAAASALARGSRAVAGADAATVAGQMDNDERDHLADRTRWLQDAAWALATAQRLFSEGGTGEQAAADRDEQRTQGLFDAARGRDDLFVRPRSAYDGAMPSGTSVVIHAYLDLAEQTDDTQHLRRAIGLIASISGAIDRSPTATANSTRALLRCLRKHSEDLREMTAGLPAATSSAKDKARGGAALQPQAGFDAVPLQVLASTDRVELAINAPSTFSVRLVIDEPYHINAAVPVVGEGFGAGTPLVGLRFGVTNGGGVRVYCDYPAGEVSGVNGELRVHRGSLDLVVVVERERDARWTGRPVLTLTYQACTETECLAPTTVELDIAIDRE